MYLLCIILVDIALLLCEAEVDECKTLSNSNLTYKRMRKKCLVLWVYKDDHFLIIVLQTCSQCKTNKKQCMAGKI